MAQGEIISGVLAPHPPHLVYADNPPQNEPRAECGWEVLRWGYERCRANVLARQPDVFIVHSPHWRTTQGHHFLGVDRFEGLSVDPIFPNLFRYRYDIRVDVELAEEICDEAREAGLVGKMMRNPHFRVDYGTIASCHMMNPAWDIPIVGISSNAAFYDFGDDAGHEEMTLLGQATRRAVEASGRRAVVLSSCSLSHRHFTSESETPEDMSKEHIYHHGQYLWDMRMLDLMKRGKAKQVADEMVDFTRQATAETKDGSLSWMLAAMDYPEVLAEVHAYGTVIGTGNAVVEWDLTGARATSSAKGAAR